MTTSPRVEDVAGLGPVLEHHRRARRLSRRRVASAIGVGIKRLDDLEGGRVVPTSAELDGLAAVFAVPVDDLVPPGHLLGPVGGVTGGEESPGSRDDAFEAVLLEYVTMVRELRNGADVARSSLRHDDLRELARALGGTPDAIEARLAELLGETDDLHDLATAIAAV